jgi:hypothetical protein
LAREVQQEVVPSLRRLGKYELIARIGEGGMAEVFLARQTGPLNFQKVICRASRNSSTCCSTRRAYRR